MSLYSNNVIKIQNIQLQFFIIWNIWYFVSFICTLRCFSWLAILTESLKKFLFGLASSCLLIFCTLCSASTDSNFYAISWSVNTMNLSWILTIWRPRISPPRCLERQSRSVFGFWWHPGLSCTIFCNKFSFRKILHMFLRMKWRQLKGLLSLWWAYWSHMRVG
jgi:hypothetical protein